MARILPPYIDKSCKSDAEKRLFTLLKTSSFATDWTILHSLNLARHTRRLYGEIDFLLMIPGRGIFVMEVKGGDVKCTDGIWFFTNRFGEVSRNKSPFSQARDAMFSMLEAIRKEFGQGHRLTKMLTGFFCAFPDISFSKHSIEYEPWQIMDRNTVNEGPESWFNHLIAETRLKHQHQQWFSETESIPNVEDIEQLCGFLRGDFERIRTSGERLDDFNRQVKSYTGEQFRVLDHIHLNERAVIQGSAGTGKTMISVESAVRAASEGKKVLLTCFNKLIGEWMREQLSDWTEQVRTVHLHELLLEESKGFDYDRSMNSHQDFYKSYLPGLLGSMFRKGIIPQFDVLIIDEGQDLIRPEYLALFDAMLKGGLAEGRWEIYGDFEQQSIYGQLTGPEMFGLLRKSATYANFQLRVNCRNTRQIGTETALLSGFERPPFLLEHLEGLPVDYCWYSGEVDQSRQLTDVLAAFAASGLPWNELVILSRNRLERSASRRVSVWPVREIRHLSDFHPKQDFFGFTTIHAFKGMEVSHIVITDINNLSDDTVRSLLYVGMSRACFRLTLMLDEALKPEYREMLKKQIV